eukprot:1650424-Rhodomonas_salina.3
MWFLSPSLFKFEAAEARLGLGIWIVGYVNCQPELCYAVSSAEVYLPALCKILFVAGADQLENLASAVFPVPSAAFRAPQPELLLWWQAMISRDATSLLHLLGNLDGQPWRHHPRLQPNLRACSKIGFSLHTHWLQKPKPRRSSLGLPDLFLLAFSSKNCCCICSCWISRSCCPTVRFTVFAAACAAVAAVRAVTTAIQKVS